MERHPEKEPPHLLRQVKFLLSAMVTAPEEDSGSDHDELELTRGGEHKLSGGPDKGLMAGGEAASAKKKKNKKKKKASQTALDELWARAMSNGEQEVPKELRLAAVPMAIQGFAFSGSLRPWYVTAQMRVPLHVAGPDYADTGYPEGEMAEPRGAPIHIYSPEEIERVRNACRIGREVLDIARTFLRTGITGDELDRVVFQACIDRNAYPSPLNYHHYPKSMCISTNEVICHGIPDCRPVEDGDIVNLDVCVFVDGMHADLNETFLVGNVDAESLGLVKTAFVSLQAAQKMIKPGTFYRDLGNEITRVAHSSGGYAVVKNFSGHGVGLQLHTAPTIPHYANSKAFGIMRPGHIFTIEPMLNLGTNSGEIMWPDQWTATTRDGRRSAQFEHTFLVTETGCEILTARPGTSKFEMTWDEAWLRRP